MLHVGAWEGYGALISIVRREARNETLLADDEKGKRLRNGERADCMALERWGWVKLEGI